MCFPGAAAVGQVVLGAASGMAEYASGQQKYEADLARYNQNYQNALAQNRAAETSVTLRQMQEGAAYAQKDHLALVEEATKEAQVEVAAAHGGVAGPVVGDLVNGIGQQIADKRAVLETNWKNTAQQLQSQKDQEVTQETMRIGEVAPPVDPSPMGSILKVAGVGLNAAGSKSGQAGLSALTNSGSVGAPMQLIGGM